MFSDSEESLSKSQLKRDARELFDLGRQLVAMSPNQLEQIPLPESVLDAVVEAQRIKSHVAHKRQLQFLAKQLRAIDPQPIIDAAAKLHGQGVEDTLKQHRLEAWREALLNDGHQRLNELIAQRPDLDRQLIRSLIRKAQRELAEMKPPAAARKLFRSLRELDDQSPLEPPRS
ncbi:MAG: ribosome biogenesis factor YjgA [Xanthomonadales bacterium]|nr:ribosome biogenesis factor YjgA [Xanthomonadales bacterium]